MTTENLVLEDFEAKVLTLTLTHKDMSAFARHVEVSAGGTLRALVSRELACSAEAAGELIQFGSVYHKPANAHIRAMREIDCDKLIDPGSYCRIHANPRRYTQRLQGIDWKSRIIEETDDFLVIDKPAGVPSSPAVDNLYECVPECLKANFHHGHVIPRTRPKPRYDTVDRSVPDQEPQPQPYLQVLHRLDTDTSGLMVLGKSSEFTRAFNLQLAKETPQRVYRTLLACSSKTRLSSDFSLIPPVGQTLEHWTLVSDRSPKEFILLQEEKRSKERYKLAASQSSQVSPLVFHR